MQFVTVDNMIRDEGVETLRGHHREAVFDAVGRKANWPAVAGVRIGPEEDLLVAGGRIRAELHLLGLRLSVAGTITGLEPGALIEAAGSEGGISATMVVRFADNADDVGRHDPVVTTVTWRFEARLPKEAGHAGIAGRGRHQSCDPTDQGQVHHQHHPGPGRSMARGNRTVRRWGARRARPGW